MPIENRNLEVGTVLVARYKKADRTCEVVETPDGLRYRLDDGTEHKSPSSAGKAAMGGVACNGWRFWSVEGTDKREPKAKKPAKAKAPAKAKKGAKTKTAKKAKAAKKPKSARAASRNDASYGCGACGEVFPTQKAAVAHAMTHTA